MLKKRKKLLILHAIDEKNKTSSYQTGYVDAFRKTAQFDCTIVNVVTSDPINERWNRWRYTWRSSYDAVILLHTIFASTLKITERWIKTVKAMNIPVVFFMNNEFYRLPQKMAFASEIGTSLLVSQCFSHEVLDIYSAKLGCPSIGLPNTHFDLQTFPKGPQISQRPIDIGYRMMPSISSLGHWEREDIAAIFQTEANERYKLDLSLRAEDRFSPWQWSKFLRNCKTQLSVASGGNIFELSDETMWRTFNYVKENPNATRENIEQLWPPKHERVPLRTLSSRIIEAASSGTPQIMYENDFGIDFQPDIHYICLKNDNSNIQDVLDRVSDHNYLTEIAKNCFECLKKETRYDATFSKFDAALSKLQ